MSLKFVLGTAAKDHQASLLEQIKTISQTDPQAKIYYIVPNHIKFATEVSVLDHLRKSSGQDILAATDIQVLSFSRLAWYFMKNEPNSYRGYRQLGLICWSIRSCGLKMMN